MQEFGTARDNHETGVCRGGTLDTQSRINMPTGIEIRDVFEAGDIAVSTSSNLWRSVFSPPSPYASQRGNRFYGTALVIGLDGKVSLDRTEYDVQCGIALLSNSSSFPGLGYSVSRRGVDRGPDGVLFTADDIILMNGESGSTLVDAIVTIGGRIGALVNSQEDMDALNAEIAGGTYITVRGGFRSPVGTLNGYVTVALYQQGAIPASYNRLMYFIGPKGVLFSRVGPPMSVPVPLEVSSTVTGPWTVANSASVEGTSAFAFFTLNPTNDYAFARLHPSALPEELTASVVNKRSERALTKGRIVRVETSDLDQDK
jgi:hypothetical protein